MEGYFPIEQYCKLTGVSKDTAHHRYIRKTVDGFKNEVGRCFLYFNDEIDPVPEGFIHDVEYAKKIGIGITTLRTTIKRGLFDKEDVVRLRYMNPLGTPYIQTYVRSNCEYPNGRSIAQQKKQWLLMNKLRPEGYLTILEFAEREKVPKSCVYQRILRGTIKEAKQVEGHWYIPETTKFERKWKNHDYKAGCNGNKS